VSVFQGKLVKYFSRQLSCKRKVSLQERNAELEGFPHLTHWFRIVNMRKEVTEEIGPDELTLEALLEMSDEQVCETVQKYGASSEECARLNASLSCLRNVHKAGSSHSKQDWAIQWPTSETGKENNPISQPEPSQWIRFHLSQSPKVQSKYNQHYCQSPQSLGPNYMHVDRLTVESYPGLFPPLEGHRSLPPSPRQRHFAHTPPRTPPVLATMTPPGTPPVRRRNKSKAPGTPPPASRKLIHLLPGFTALHRSKSHEFQLGNRVDEAQTPKTKKKTKPLNLKIHNSVGSCENIPSQRSPLLSQRSPLLSERSLRSFFVGYPSFLPSTPPVHSDATFSANTLSVPRWSPQIPRRDLGNSIKHRSLYQRWLQCYLTGNFLMAWLKCHNKCTKEAPPCHLLLIQRGGIQQEGSHLYTGMDELQSTPNPTLTLHCCSLAVMLTPKVAMKIKDQPLTANELPDFALRHEGCSSVRKNAPEPLNCASRAAANPLHPSPECTRQQKQFNLTASHYYRYKQQFIFPDVTPEEPSRAPQVILHPVNSDSANEGNPLLQIEVEPTSDNEDGNDEAEDSEDEFEEMNLSLLSARNFPRKASQTSIFLQEWDIPFEQLEIGELIGKGRFGQVFHGRWHGEIAIRLIDIERDNEDQLKAFKREVMAYRNTRHENVVLFMGACMSPPHLAIITSLCKGRTLYSVVRDAKIVLDVNKTRQIAQEIVKGMGYLHAKGILHKDMKSKNVFYDNGKVVITDFGLFTISGVLQAGSRREDKLRIPSGWLCHLAPEVIRQLSPDTEEDKLPFSKQSDVFAFGTIWYELHAREWPFKNQPAEAIIWQVGSGMKPNLSQIGMGKEISDILIFCWAFEQEERLSFSKLMEMLEKLPKRNRRLSHPGHFWKSAEYV
ncbi:KSR2 Kinase, partial [Polyodon spathula]|nr:KSR2 Kinase [Polyodon spathula]